MILSQVEKLYDDYISKVRKIEQQMKPTDGLLGFGRKISDDPCHESFAEELQDILEEYEKTSPGSDEVKEVLRFIFGIPLKYEDSDSIYWMLNAVHSLTLGLTGFLSADDASEILEEYKNNYPRSKRLPAQKKLIRLLEKASSG